ncbi:BLUF domain-containing protein [Enterovibrio calviensis]|uniref:BLUF domain-containing protein n=1 Tax=Enterovibrio calviensis TaxID=91359 RepID=UPI000688E4FA|nr:BLUF domain-containing protein [Enterovibrio calviensis]
MLIAIVYTSESLFDFDMETLKALMVQSRVNNTKHGITGLLLYREREFIQVLEGEEEDVNSAYQHIKNDFRHKRVEAIFKEPIERRYFPNWSMGLCRAEKSATLRDRPLSDLKYDKISVYKLLHEFKRGDM